MFCWTKGQYRARELRDASTATSISRGARHLVTERQLRLNRA